MPDCRRSSNIGIFQSILSDNSSQYSNVRIIPNFEIILTLLYYGFIKSASVIGRIYPASLVFRGFGMDLALLIGGIRVTARDVHRKKE